MNDFSIMLNRIKALKKERGFTNETLSQTSGVPKSTLDKILAGIIKDPSIISIIKIAKALEVSADYILGWEEEKQLLSFSSTTETYTAAENQLISNFRKLNSSGKEKASDYVEDLTTIDKYTAADEIQSKLG